MFRIGNTDVIDMAVSMTGYGRAVSRQDGGRVLVEIKSVNHRFSDVQFRMPKQLLAFEDRLKQLISEQMERGRIDVFISLDGISPSRKQAHVDWSLLTQFLDRAEEMERLDVFDSRLDLQDFLFHPEIVSVEEETDIQDGWQLIIESTVREAMTELKAMRMEEGKKLREDLSKRIDKIQQLTNSIQEQAPAVIKEYQERLKERIQEYLNDSFAAEEQRLLTETALLADKMNVEEELTRLYSHCDQFRVILDGEGTIGRKLDFLVQEMHREMNTIGAKVNNAALSHIVVDLKSELEKIKEQVQNIE